MSRRRRHPDARGFSLVELLMAMFILGVGVISIAALFPAGIAQQRRSVDDVLGPIVANNALAVLRAELRPADFGTFEEFGAAASIVTIEGDWPWLRPATVAAGADDALPLGAVDVFNVTGLADAVEPTPLVTGIPHNTRVHPGGAPAVLITREERFYPQQSAIGGAVAAPRPQYLWECMFRRFQGKVLVAVFVYRVNLVGGEPARTAAEPDGLLPLRRRLPGETGWDCAGADGIPGTANARLAGSSCAAYDPTRAREAWQVSGQWILDQNNNVHRVLSSYCDSASGQRVVELVRPVSAVPALPIYSTGTDETTDIVTDAWYLPVVDEDGRRITPVYVTVKEL